MQIGKSRPVSEKITRLLDCLPGQASRGKAAIALLSLALLSGCASLPNGGVIGQPDTAQIQQVTFGKVIATKDVLIKQQSDGRITGLGRDIGSIIGNSSATNPLTKRMTSLVGDMIGNTIGGSVETAVNAQRAQTITVRADNGMSSAITQPVTDQAFRAGQRVAIANINGRQQVLDAATLLQSRPDLGSALPRSTGTKRNTRIASLGM